MRQKQLRSVRNFNTDAPMLLLLLLLLLNSGGGNKQIDFSNEAYKFDKTVHDDRTALVSGKFFIFVTT